MLHVWNPRGGWWGEGDEKFFVDGEKFPSTFGTGSEDYFGYAWCDPHLFQRPYHAQTMTQMNKGHQSVLRWHITDNVPFETSFEGCIEKYDHPGPGRQVCQHGLLVSVARRSRSVRARAGRRPRRLLRHAAGRGQRNPLARSNRRIGECPRSVRFHEGKMAEQPADVVDRRQAGRQAEAPPAGQERRQVSGRRFA